MVNISIINLNKKSGVKYSDNISMERDALLAVKNDARSTNKVNVNFHWNGKKFIKQKSPLKTHLHEKRKKLIKK